MPTCEALPTCTNPVKWIHEYEGLRADHWRERYLCDHHAQALDNAARLRGWPLPKLRPFPETLDLEISSAARGSLALRDGRPVTVPSRSAQVEKPT